MADHDDPPPGYMFRPDTDQLLLLYLRPKLEGEAYPQWLVPYCDLYGDKEPWEIWKDFKDASESDKERKDLYFLTQHKMKTTKGKRKKRTVGRGGGTWKGQDAAKNVLLASSPRRVIGKRKRFHYEKEGSEQNGRWLMHEFELDASLLSNKHKAKDFVLCILRKNDKSKKDLKHEGQEDQEEDGDDGDDDQQVEDLPDEPEFVIQQTGSTTTQTSGNSDRKYGSTTTQTSDQRTFNLDVKQFEVYLNK